MKTKHAICTNSRRWNGRPTVLEIVPDKLSAYNVLNEIVECCGLVTCINLLTSNDVVQIAVKFNTHEYVDWQNSSTIVAKNIVILCVAQ